MARMASSRTRTSGHERDRTTRTYARRVGRCETPARRRAQGQLGTKHAECIDNTEVVVGQARATSTEMGRRHRKQAQACSRPPEHARPPARRGDERADGRRSTTTRPRRRRRRRRGHGRRQGGGRAQLLTALGARRSKEENGERDRERRRRDSGEQAYGEKMARGEHQATTAGQEKQENNKKYDYDKEGT